MRPVLRCFAFGLISLGLLVAAGCTYESPIDFKEKWELKPGQLRFNKNSGPAKVSEIDVSAEIVTGESIDIAVVYEDHFEEAKKAMLKGEEPPTWLWVNMKAQPPETGKKLTVEAKRPFVVLVRNPHPEIAVINLKIKTVKGPRL